MSIAKKIMTSADVHALLCDANNLGTELRKLDERLRVHPNINTAKAALEAERKELRLRHLAALRRWRDVTVDFALAESQRACREMESLMPEYERARNRKLNELSFASADAFDDINARIEEYRIIKGRANASIVSASERVRQEERRP